MSKYGEKPNDERRLTRREFVAAAGTAALGMTVTRAAPSGADESRRPSTTREDSFEGPIVAITRDRNLIPARIVQRGLLRTHVDHTVAAAVGAPDAGTAWHRLLKEDDNILIKFNQSMAAVMGTTDAMAEALVGSLTASGFDPNRITLLEVAPEIRATTKTRSPDYRWQGKDVEFGESGRDSFSADLDWATAVINVPFLKTHHMAVMTGCLKNLSHGLIRHPARFHSGGCDPSIAEINATKDLRSRVKLSIINGLRVEIGGRQIALVEDIATEGLLIASRDSVACDTIGFHQIGRIRAERGIKPLLPGPALPKQLTSAARLGVGVANRERVSVHSVVWQAEE